MYQYNKNTLLGNKLIRAVVYYSITKIRHRKDSLKIRRMKLPTFSLQHNYKHAVISDMMYIHRSKQVAVKL